jgi:hypothetical protein
MNHTTYYAPHRYGAALMLGMIAGAFLSLAIAFGL